MCDNYRLRSGDKMRMPKIKSNAGGDGRGFLHAIIYFGRISIRPGPVCIAAAEEVRGGAKGPPLDGCGPHFNASFGHRNRGLLGPEREPHSGSRSQINCTRNGGLTLIKCAFDLKMISLIRGGPPFPLFHFSTLPLFHFPFRATTAPPPT